MLNSRSTTNGQICARCVMDTTDRRIKFDSDGNCNHCNRALLLRGSIIGRKKITDSDDERDFAEWCDTNRKSRNVEFDGICGVSGGVDSSYLVHLLCKYGYRPLLLHVDGGWNSSTAARNIDKIIQANNLTLETVVIDWKEMRNLQLAYLKSGLKNQDVPQDHAFFASLYSTARDYGIKDIVSGSNYATESILPKDWGYGAMDGTQIRYVARWFGKFQLDKYQTISTSELFKLIYLKRDLKVHTPLNLVNYSKQKATQELAKNYGWEDYGGKHRESRFTTYFQDIYLPERFGIDKRRAHLSSLIINGEISRDQALRQLAQKPSTELERLRLERFVADKLQIEFLELRNFSKLPYRSHLRYPNSQLISLVISSMMHIRFRLKSLKARYLVSLNERKNWRLS